MAEHLGTSRAVLPGQSSLCGGHQSLSTSTIVVWAEFQSISTLPRGFSPCALVSSPHQTRLMPVLEMTKRATSLLIFDYFRPAFFKSILYGL